MMKHESLAVLGIVALPFLASADGAINVAKITAELYAHYSALVARADREATAEKPIPYAFVDGEIRYIAPEDWCFPAASQVDWPFNYADYYFLEALLRYEVAKDRPKIILDTDMRTDWDDVGAIMDELMCRLPRN